MLAAAMGWVLVLAGASCLTNAGAQDRRTAKAERSLASHP